MFAVQDIVGHKSAKPMFVVEGAERFDLYQGQLGTYNITV